MNKLIPLNLGFVSHPSEDSYKTNDLIIEFSEILHKKGMNEWLKLFSLLNRYLEEENPVYIIELFITCQNNNIYPPLDALEWISDSFSKWHDSNANDGLKPISMDQAMGLKGKGRSSNKMRTAIQRQMLDMLMHEIHVLKMAFEVTNSQAAEMIEARLSETEWNQSGYKLTEYSADTLIDRYERNYAKVYNSLRQKNQKPAFNQQKKTDILTNYPEYAYERFIKSL